MVHFPSLLQDKKHHHPQWSAKMIHGLWIPGHSYEPVDWRGQSWGGGRGAAREWQFDTGKLTQMALPRHWNLTRHLLQNHWNSMERNIGEQSGKIRKPTLYVTRSWIPESPSACISNLSFPLNLQSTDVEEKTLKRLGYWTLRVTAEPDFKRAMAARKLQLQGEKSRAETNSVHYTKLNLIVFWSKIKWQANDSGSLILLGFALIPPESPRCSV